MRPLGVMAADGADGTLVPVAFVAVTVMVYAVPFVRPVIVQARVPLVTHLALPGEAVAVYRVIVLPPPFAGAVQPTAMRAFPAVPTTLSGALGAEGGRVSAKEWLRTVSPRAPFQPSIAIA